MNSRVLHTWLPHIPSPASWDVPVLFGHDSSTAWLRRANDWPLWLLVRNDLQDRYVSHYLGPFLGVVLGNCWLVTRLAMGESRRSQTKKVPRQRQLLLDVPIRNSRAPNNIPRGLEPCLKSHFMASSNRVVSSNWNAATSQSRTNRVSKEEHPRPESRQTPSMVHAILLEVLDLKWVRSGKAPRVCGPTRH